LLPGHPTCMALITSRDRLTGLVATDGARRRTLEVLTPDEATALLGRLLRESRAAAEPRAVEDLARVCAGLPLALRMSAGLGWGLGVGLFAMLIGPMMIDPMNEWVQQAAGSYETPLGVGTPGLPVTNWSLDAGDLRAPHFVGLHALQVLPLGALLLARRATKITYGGKAGLVHVAGPTYLGLVGLLLWQALRAEPVTRPGVATLVTGGLLLAATAAATVWILHGARHGSLGSSGNREDAHEP
jgi:hypothetical protein